MSHQDRQEQTQLFFLKNSTVSGNSASFGGTHTCWVSSDTKVGLGPLISLETNQVRAVWFQFPWMVACLSAPTGLKSATPNNLHHLEAGGVPVTCIWQPVQDSRHDHVRAHTPFPTWLRSSVPHLLPHLKDLALGRLQEWPPGAEHRSHSVLPGK
jgi:hypothetical protein